MNTYGCNIIRQFQTMAICVPICLNNQPIEDEDGDEDEDEYEDEDEDEDEDVKM